MINKINISMVGHGEGESTHGTQNKFLKELFNELNYEIVVSDIPREDCLNLLYEGWNNQDGKISKFLSNKKCKYGIIFTEQLISLKDLNSKYYTINNFNIKNNKSKKKFYLYFLHFITIYNQAMKKICLKLRTLHTKISYFTKLQNNYAYRVFLIKFILLSISILRKIILFIHLNNFDVKKNYNKIFKIILFGIYFKEIYNDTYSYLNRFSFSFQLGLDDNYDHLIKENKINHHHTLPFLITRKESFEQNQNKKYDLLFTGRMTKIREKFLKKIKEKFENYNILVSEMIHNTDEWRQKIKQSKYILNINQYENQSFVSVAKVYQGMKLNVPNIVQVENQNMSPKYIEDYYLKFNEKEFYEVLKNYLDNYDYYLDLFQKMRKKFISFSENEKQKFAEFLIKNK